MREGSPIAKEDVEHELKGSSGNIGIGEGLSEDLEQVNE